MNMQHFCLQHFIPAPNLLFEVLVVFDHFGVLKLLFIAVIFGFKSYTSEKCFNVNNVNFIYDISAFPNYFLSDPGNVDHSRAEKIYTDSKYSQVSSKWLSDK